MTIVFIAAAIVNVLAQFQPRGVSPTAYTDLGDIVPIIIIPALCGMIGWLAGFNANKSFASQSADRNASASVGKDSEFARYRQSDRHRRRRRFFENISTEQPTSLREILGSMQKGVIFTAIGLGGLFLRMIFPTGFGVFILATILIGAIGVGFLISSVIAYRLSKSWGLMSPAETKKFSENIRDGSLFR